MYVEGTFGAWKGLRPGYLDPMLPLESNFPQGTHM